MRLISSDDVIKAVDKHTFETKDGLCLDDDITCILEEVPTIEKSQWIPCNWHTKEENLPQECKSVLICMKDSYGYRIGISYRTDYNRWEGFGRVNVIAWMPQPWIPLPEEARKENQ